MAVIHGSYCGAFVVRLYLSRLLLALVNLLFGWCKLNVIEQLRNAVRLGKQLNHEITEAKKGLLEMSSQGDKVKALINEIGEDIQEVLDKLANASEEGLSKEEVEEIVAMLEPIAAKVPEPVDPPEPEPTT